MAFTINETKRMYQLQGKNDAWQQFDPASDNPNDLTFENLQNNLIAICSAMQDNKDGILIMATIADRDRHHTVHIFWNWTRYPSTADLIEAGLPGTNYNEWIWYLDDNGIASDSQITLQAVDNLQILINRRRDQVGLPVDDTDRVNGE